MADAAAPRDFTLEPEDGERLANLAGPLDAHFRQIELRLGVQIANRGRSARSSGDHTRTDIVVADAVKGSVGTEKFEPVDTVVPAHNSAVADFTTRATLFEPPTGSTTMVESSAPPKPVSVYVTKLESNVIGLQPGGGGGVPPNITSSK